MPSANTGGVRGPQVLDLRNIEVTNDQPPIFRPHNLTFAGPRLDAVRRPTVTSPAAIIATPAIIAPTPLAQTQFSRLVIPTVSWPRLQKPLAVTIAALALIIAVAKPTSTSHRPAEATNSNSKTAVTAPAALHAKSASSQTKTPTITNPQLQQMLSGFANSTGANFGIYVKDLKTGSVGTSAPDVVFKSASLYKLFVATEIYKRVDTGNLQLGASAGNGTGLTIGQCINYMITVSDNDCGQALGVMLGWGSQNPALQNLGFKHTSLAEPQQTSASDVGLLLERLYNGTLLSPNSSQQFVDLLKAQQINNRLPAGLPDGTVVAHKTGDLDSFVHDAGIVYGPKTDYIIVAMSGSWGNLNEASGKIADLSSRVYSFFNQ